MECKHTKDIAELNQFWQGGEQPTWEIKYNGITAIIVDHDKEYQSFQKRQNVAEHIVKCLNAHDELVKLFGRLTEMTRFVEDNTEKGCGYSSLLTDCEKMLQKLTNKETLSPTLQKKYDQLWNK